MSKLDSVFATGVSGSQYQFDVYALNAEFNDVGAVYMFLKRSQASYEPVYIGETGQLGTRLGTHEKWRCVTRHGATFIGVHVDGGPRSRLDKETDLRQNYATSCNDQ